MGINIRPVTLNDCKLLFDWVNDPDVRKASFNSKPIDWTEHQNWFLNKKKDPNSIILILEYFGDNVGQIRFDRNPQLNNFLISYLIGKNFRGRSLGTVIISEGLNYLTTIYTPPYKITGFVKKDNIASQKSFFKNKFISLEKLDDRIKFIKNIQ